MTQIPEGATHIVADIYGLTEDQKDANGRFCYRKKAAGVWFAFKYGAWHQIVFPQPDRYQRIPAQWTGEGRPPVGTVCEFNGSGAACPYDPWHPDLKDGDHVTIIAYFNDSVGEIAAFTFKARNENIAAIQVEQARPGAFRPIRTQAQLAAEEREKAIEFMMQMTSSLGHSDVSKKILFGELYDKGLRFEVKP